MSLMRGMVYLGFWSVGAGGRGWDCLCHCHLAECCILNPFCAAWEDRSGHGHWCCSLPVVQMQSSLPEVPDRFHWQPALPAENGQPTQGQCSATSTKGRNTCLQSVVELFGERFHSHRFAPFLFALPSGVVPDLYARPFSYMPCLQLCWWWVDA